MQKQQHTTPEHILKSLEDQIAYYEERVAALKLTLKLMREQPPQPAYFFNENAKITKELVRKFMQQVKKPMQTVEVVNILYPRAEQDVKDKAVKTLSVVFNTLEKDGQIKSEKQEGIKGNFYTWIESKKPQSV